MRHPHISLSEVDHVAGWILQPGVNIISTVVAPGNRDDELGFGFNISFFDTRVDQQEGDDKQQDKANQRIE